MSKKKSLNKQMADEFRAHKLQRELLRNLITANQLFNTKYSW